MSRAYGDSSCRSHLSPQIAGTEEVARFLAEEISPDTYLNLMDEYRPCYRAGDYPDLDRSITRPEFREALELAHRYGLMFAAIHSRSFDSGSLFWWASPWPLSSAWPILCENQKPYRVASPRGIAPRSALPHTSQRVDVK